MLKIFFFSVCLFLLKNNNNHIYTKKKINSNRFKEIIFKESTCLTERDKV